MLHKRETSPETESFLKENDIKFKGDCLTVIKLLYSGLRLNGHDLVKKYGMDSRRLRNVIAARPDIVCKEWKLNKNGKRMYVEYFIKPILLPTKRQAIEEGQRILDTMNKATQLALL